MRLSSCLAAGAVLFALPCLARAADIDGKNQLQLQTGLLQISSTQLRYDDSSGYADVRRTQRTIGFFPRFGLGYGRGLTNQLVFHLLGGVALTTNTADFDEDSPFSDGVSVEDGFEFEVTPALRYVAPGKKVRFFLGAGAGLSAAFHESEQARTASVAVLLGGVAGMHVFLNDRVSLDPNLELGGLFGRTSHEPDKNLTVEGSARGVRFVMSVGLSGWLGGSDAPRLAAPVQPAAPGVVAQPEPVAADGVLSALAPLQGLGLHVEGAPVFRGDALRVGVDHLARSSAWQTCRVTLVGGPQPVVVSARLRTEPTARGLVHEELSGFVGVLQLRDWLAGAPRLAVCDVEQPIEGPTLRQLRQLLADFERVARQAGTFPSEAAPAAPMRVIEPVPAPVAPVPVPSEPPAAEPAASQLSVPVPASAPAPAQTP